VSNYVLINNPAEIVPKQLIGFGAVSFYLLFTLALSPVRLIIFYLNVKVSEVWAGEWRGAAVAIKKMRVGGSAGQANVFMSELDFLGYNYNLN
jgi:hypothetical protein